MSRAGTPGDDGGAMFRELVLASAGTGKTYTLSGRVIGLLAAGVPPDEVLASTFTRKAAGEILDRVLGRLSEASLDPGAARELAGSALLHGDRPPPEQLQRLFQEVLRVLVSNLHRLNIGTLDSFFIRVARSFSPELGLPPEWSIVDEPTAQSLESQALLQVLQEPSRETIIELVRMTMRGESDRGIHDRLLGQLRDMRELGSQAEQGLGADPWAGVGDAGPEVRAESLDDLAAALEKASLPEAKDGRKDKRFADAVSQASEALRERDWAAFCGKGLGKNLLGGVETYYSKPIPGELQGLLADGLSMAKRAVGLELNRQVRALRALFLAYDHVLSRFQQARGAYRFQDITMLLREGTVLGEAPDVWFRLDQRARHLLLDEFQDTALVQWEALSPLAEELLSGHLAERSATLVADPKQSIYGWRGADPKLVRRLAKQFTLDSRTLHHSYRSSGSVLGFVNQVFADLPDNPSWQHDPDGAAQAREWAEDFSAHLPGRDLPGFVQVRAGPRDQEMGRSDRPAMMAWAAHRIAEITREAPERSLGVLVRRNATVSRLLVELRKLGVPASEEGATTLEDSPAVSTLLALLRLADHPGDTIAAYQVQHSPLAGLVDVGEHPSTRWAPNLADRIRADLMSQGYGPTLSGLVTRLGEEGVVGPRDLHRLLQLTQLGYRWDENPTLRPGDFIRFVSSEPMESPLDTPVRVMTVHQAKGLEFDVVVLPEMDLPLTRGQGRFKGVLPLRDPGTGRVTRIFPRVGKELLPLFPELLRAAKEESRAELRDALGVLYVALTRARHGLHIFVAADPTPLPKKAPLTHARLIRGALGADREAFREGDTVFESGEPDWAARADTARRQEPEPDGAPRDHAAPEALRPTLARRAERRRNLSHRAPSSLVGRHQVDLRRALSLTPDPARERGSIVHAWLETVEWLEDWIPDEDRLRRLAQREGLNLHPDSVQALLAQFRSWLAAPEVRECLSRGAYPDGARVEAELPFAVPLGGDFFTGVMDRVVFWESDGVVVGAEVLDFKTGGIGPGMEEGIPEMAERYRPQVEVYRRALERIYGLPAGAVGAKLVFLSENRVVSS